MPFLWQLMKQNSIKYTIEVTTRQQPYMNRGQFEFITTEQKFRKVALT